MAAAKRAAWSLWTKTHVANLLAGKGGACRATTALRYVPACDRREEALPAACSCRRSCVRCAAAHSTPGARGPRGETRSFAVHLWVLTVEFFRPLAAQRSLLQDRTKVLAHVVAEQKATGTWEQWLLLPRPKGDGCLVQGCSTLALQLRMEPGALELLCDAALPRRLMGNEWNDTLMLPGAVRRHHRNKYIMLHGDECTCEPNLAYTMQVPQWVGRVLPALADAVDREHRAEAAAARRRGGGSRDRVRERRPAARAR